jgi:general secretion pathway protein E
VPEAATAPPARQLGELLVESGLLTGEQVDRATRDAAAAGRRLASYAVEEELVSEADMASMLSLQLHLPLIDLRRHTVQSDAVALVPEECARQHQVVPLDVVGDSLVVVMADPGDIVALEELQTRARMPVQLAIGIPSDIEEAINRYYRASDEIEEQLTQAAAQAAAVPAEQAPADLAVMENAQGPIVRTVELLLTQAIRDRASDIHLEPQEDHLRIRYRIDGFLHEVQALPLSVHPALVSRLKVLAAMNIADRRRPQDGQFSYRLDERDVDIRVATCDSSYGEMAVLRVLDKSTSLLGLSELGFLPEARERYTEMLRAPCGMLLVGGPTGAGKTTTLYASVGHLDRKGRNIVSIEDPIEYQIQDVNQIQVNPRADITFVSGLRFITRLDPDVILVGEVRDSDTAKMATQAALTGHLVLSSVHANDAAGILVRMLDLGVEPFLISSALVGVVAQRMVRRVCRYCRTLAQTSMEEQLALARQEHHPPEQLYHGAGCNFCANTGYLGRTGIFEVLTLSDELRRMLVTGTGSRELMSRAIDEGMTTMSRDGMLKVQQGITTPSEVLRSVSSI